LSEKGFKKLREKFSDFVNSLRGKSKTSEQESGPSMDLTDARVEELLDKLAKEIADRGFERPAMFYVGLLKPFWPLALPLSYMAVPFLDFFGINLREYIAILENYDNVKRLEKKIEALQKD